MNRPNSTALVAVALIAGFFLAFLAPLPGFSTDDACSCCDASACPLAAGGCAHHRELDDDSCCVKSGQESGAYAFGAGVQDSQPAVFSEVTATLCPRVGALRGSAPAPPPPPASTIDPPPPR